MLIPLSHVALEVNATADQLAHQLADRVLTDDVGRLAIDRSVARELITEHHQRLAAKAERAQRQAAEHKARMRELDARNRAERRGGIPATVGSTAYADMVAVDQR